MKTTELAIGMLRQWLNEERITDSKKMVTSEEIKHWLEIEEFGDKGVTDFEFKLIKEIIRPSVKCVGSSHLSISSRMPVYVEELNFSTLLIEIKRFYDNHDNGNGNWEKLILELFKNCRI